MIVYKIKNIIAYFLIVAGVLYCSGYSYSTVGSAWIKVVMIFLCALGCFIFKPGINIRKKIRVTPVNLTIFMLSIGAIFSYIFNFEKNVWLDPIMLIATLEVANILTDKISFSRFIDIYGITLSLIVIVAIGINIVLNLGLNIPSYIYTNLRGQTFNTIWICTWVVGDNRIMGPFWEPGLFSTFLIIGLFFEVIINNAKKSRLWVIFTLIVGIILSQSAAGYLLLVLILYLWFHKGRKIKIIWDIITITLICLVVYFQDYISFLLYEMNQDVFWKLIEDSITANTRQFSPVICFQIFMENPLVGNGLSLAIERYNVLKNTVVDSLTSTNVFFLSAFGIWGISYTICWIEAFLKQKQYSITFRMLLLLLFGIILNKEPHYNLMLTYIVLFYLVKDTFTRHKNKI